MVSSVQMQSPSSLSQVSMRQKPVRMLGSDVVIVCYSQEEQTMEWMEFEGEGEDGCGNVKMDDEKALYIPYPAGNQHKRRVVVTQQRGLTMHEPALS